jgi:glutathione S-transferase
MLRLWGRTTSSNVQKVLWLTDEIGLPLERIEAGGAFGVVDEPAYRAMNPNGLVPTIDDDGFVLWESNTVLRYLAATRGADGLYPTEPTRRADVERWMDWNLSTLGPALAPAFFGLVRTPAAQRDPAAIAAAGSKAAGALAILDAQLQARPFVCGEALTLADIGPGINVYRWYNLDFASVGYQRPELPALRAWHERLAQRPAYRKWVMIPIT